MTGSSPSNDENPPSPPFPKGGHESSSLWQREVRRDFRTIIEANIYDLKEVWQNPLRF